MILQKSWRHLGTMEKVHKNANCEIRLALDSRLAYYLPYLRLRVQDKDLY